MMSVLQEVEGLTKFIILPVGRPVSMQISDSMYTEFTCFDLRRYSLRYNVLSGLIIISFSRSKRVRSMCLYPRSEENLFACKVSSLVQLPLLSYFFMKKKRKKMKRKNL